jgi:hypothetical protein
MRSRSATSVWPCDAIPGFCNERLSTITYTSVADLFGGSERRCEVTAPLELGGH